MRIDTRALSVRRGETWSLSDVSLQIPEGTHALVLGAPSSGKSTLLKTLAGLVRPSQGSVSWDGVPTGQLTYPQKRAHQASLGMIFQTDALFDSISVLENVLLPLRKRNVPPDEALTRAREALVRVGLGQAEDQLPEQLSGGMRKRAGIARAWVARPAVLLADDPFAGLDPRTEREVAELLVDVSHHRTLLVAAPEPPGVLPFGRWIVLDAGTLRHDGPPCSPRAWEAR